jgi:plasmid stability protein
MTALPALTSMTALDAINANLEFIVNIVYNECMQQIETPMATLTIRNVAAEAKEQLRVRAARHGRSMESELRSILMDALRDTQDMETDLATAIRRRVAPLGGVDLKEHPPVPLGDPPSFK